MLFAAKLQAGERTQITAFAPGRLVLTNVALQEGSAASLYLQAGENGEILVVALAEPRLTAYHTEIHLTMNIKGSQALTARNGNVSLLGHFIADDGYSKAGSIEEVISVRREDAYKQSKNARPRGEAAEPAKRETNKSEPIEKQEEVSEAPRRRSQRARVPAPPAKPQTKPKKQIKFNSGSKSNSILEMMYNLKDEEDEEESDYSEEQESSSSSSSSSDDEDSEQTPKRSSKKEAKQQKIQRKDDASPPERHLTSGTAEGSNGSEQHRVIKEHESNPPQQQTGLRQAAEGDLGPNNLSLESEIEKSLEKVANTLLKKVMQEMPPLPAESSKNVAQGAFNTSSARQSEQALWLHKYRKFLASLEDKILSFSLEAEDERPAREKQLLAENKRLKEEISTLKAASREGARGKEGGRGGEAGEERAREKKDGKGDQSAFLYRIPTAIPDFALKK